MMNNIKQALDILKLTREIAVDYDGYNKSEDLKSLIDEIISYNKKVEKILKEIK